MHVKQLWLQDFRNYTDAQLALSPGITTLVGLNGQGKTNLVESIRYLSTLRSHRVAQDAPLIRQGQTQATIQAAVDISGRTTTLEIVIKKGANKGKLNRSPVARVRDLVGTLRTVIFAPEDLQLVKADPAVRRTFIDDILLQLSPRFVSVQHDYDRALKQRNALLRSAKHNPLDEGSFRIWTEQVARLGSEIIYARGYALQKLAPHVQAAYEQVAGAGQEATYGYKSRVWDVESFESFDLAQLPAPDELSERITQSLADHRGEELGRGTTAVGPHRDDLTLLLGGMLAKNYASHGESWSFALALKMATFAMLIEEGLGEETARTPVLILDDVFAELDSARRVRLAEVVQEAEQVLVTAAVGEDVPDDCRGQEVFIRSGEIVVD